MEGRRSSVLKTVVIKTAQIALSLIFDSCEAVSGRIGFDRSRSSWLPSFRCEGCVFALRGEISWLSQWLREAT